MNKSDKLSINTIRILSAEAIQKASSGHPGLPLGAAPMAYTLWAEHLKHNPKNPSWADRDRFVLSAGHGSAMLYSLMHLFGYDCSIDDIKNFRQLGSKTAGHPEHGYIDGIETTTGPLGQGIANAVGLAMAEAHLAAMFNKPGYDVVDHYTYVLSGDGCLMEGVASEACSLAGTQKLGKLILLYDRNKITIEGETDFAFDEDVAKRYEAYGWQTITVEDGNEDTASISAAIAKAKAETGKPSIIIIKTDIGYGCPPVQGCASCHGAPLGDENIAIMKETLGWDYEGKFYVPDEVKDAAKTRQESYDKTEAEWIAMFAEYRSKHADMAALWDTCFGDVDEALLNDKAMYEFDGKMATRNSSNIVLNRLSVKLPQLFGGSADLGPANKSVLNDSGYFAPDCREGKNIHYGIREFGMSAIANGMYLHGGIIPYVATFFVFTDYLKNALRMSALMELPVIYVMTHDSIGVGEDGPTHQPIEQLAGLRATPNTFVWRPADSKETAAAYLSALSAKGPSVIALSRQDLPLYDGTGDKALKGAYVLKDFGDNPQILFIGTGSEVELCMNAAEKLYEEGVSARVVSMPCMDVFEMQLDAYKESVIPSSIEKRIVVEAGSSFGWAKYYGAKGDVVAIDTFGTSAPAAKVFEKYGFTLDNVMSKAKAVLAK
ncbi:MAG: transketolase [Clostridia bacterium]|nr:transketolase [Clostridia bacterium]MBT7121918.1 transketolase [Clostridia bacterium]